MAHAVFSEHPLENYLQDAGELPEPMPGIVHDFMQDEPDEGAPSSWLSDATWVPQFALQAMETVRNVISAVQPTAHHSSFGERFKYDVISSSLLSTTLPSPHRTTRRPIPGKLSPEQSRVPSREPSPPAKPIQTPSSRHPPTASDHWPETTGLVVTLLSFSAGYYLLSAATLAGISYYMHTTPMDSSKPDITSTLDALNDLIVAGNAWDSVIHEAITRLEEEERIKHHGLPSPSLSPVYSTIRIALHSSLHVTQTQCDNVRHLLAALAAPSELSQLSEMYAPPSPISSPKHHTPHHSISSTPRPPNSRSLSYHHSLASPSMRDKRSTWNGAYASLALAGRSTSPTKRSRRRLDMTSLLDVAPGPQPSKESMSAPSTPSIPATITLDTPSNRSSVHGGQSPEEEVTLSLPGSPHFGMAALDLQRKRRSGGLEVFGFAGTSHPSRFTTLQTTRDPLRAALAARRWACAHLLALRFDEEEERDGDGPGVGGYWEDVRSVITLLTGALGDATARLSDALEDAAIAKARLEEATSTESSEGSPGPSSRETAASLIKVKPSAGTSRSRAMPFVGFAPVPSHLARFAAHVDAISTALDDARGHLEACVAALKDNEDEHVKEGEAPPEEVPLASTQDAPALLAYERLRRELGLALRECERGRERLLELVSPRGLAEDADPDDLPGLAHDMASDESDKPDNTTSFSSLFSTDGYVLDGLAKETGDEHDDDATGHLLMTATTRHLPLPGVEQVYEAETGPLRVIARGKSPLTREERIRAMKERRASSEAAQTKSPGEAWGPGGEVVQELKDVIWKVGERRRMLTDSQVQVGAVPLLA